MLKMECVKCRKFCLCLWMALFVWSYSVRKTQQCSPRNTKRSRARKASHRRLHATSAKWKCIRVVRWKAFFRLDDLQNVSLCWWKRRPREQQNYCVCRNFLIKTSFHLSLSHSILTLLNQHSRRFRDLFVMMAQRIIIKNMQRPFKPKISPSTRNFCSAPRIICCIFNAFLIMITPLDTLFQSNTFEGGREKLLSFYHSSPYVWLIVEFLWKYQSCLIYN